MSHKWMSGMPGRPSTNQSESSLSVSQLLDGLSLFAGLSTARRRSLAQECYIRRVPRGAYLFLQGDPADAFYIVGSGSIAIVLSSPEGRELVINEMRPGDCFGELGLLTGETRSTHALARSPKGSDVLVIPRETFLTMLEAEPSLARRLLETTARRLRDSSERESALAFLDAPARLARVLLRLDQEASEEGYITISQDELAQRASLTRQTAAKILGRWRRRGWLLTGRGHIMLLNRAKLEQVETEMDRQDR
jgi:CRP/FNR family transcriptional regulator, cyclic AMP receptor protein